MTDRPRSIRWFEWAYLGALALSLLSVVILWPQLMASMASTRGLERVGPGAVQAIVVAGVLLPTVIGLLLWFFVARRQSGIARYVTALVLAYAIYSTGAGLVLAGSPSTLATACEIASVVLELVALVMLFMPDARIWFDRAVGEGRT